VNVAPPRSFADLVGFTPRAAAPDLEAHGTTVLALRFDQGVLTLADRRATMGNLIVFDHAEKIVALDDATVVAISGSFARSIEVCRLLQHAFKYYARMHLHEMSLEGKLNEISKALAGNLPSAMQGIGLFLPILAAYDRATGEFQVYFFDSAGARFESAAYAAAGSGSERIRGVFEYLSRTGKPWEKRKLEDAMLAGLRMLDIAADLDAATGGFAKVLPAANVLDANGNRPVGQPALERLVAKVLGR
jgi:proteasome beta subunit